MDDGHVTEHGTYDALVEQDGEFARLDREFGGQGESEEAKTNVNAINIAEVRNKSRRSAGVGRLEGRLIVKEKRSTGSVSWSGKNQDFYPWIKLTPHQCMGHTSPLEEATSLYPWCCYLFCLCKGVKL
jgi:hypothetical protein